MTSIIWKAIMNQLTKPTSSSLVNLTGRFAGPTEPPFRKGISLTRVPFTLIFGAALLMAGCHSALVVQTPVGPEPFGRQTGEPNGQLLVFSAKEARADGDDPTYYQHSDYSVYNSKGKRIKHVGNSEGHFDEAPRLVSLPPGTYTVKARAECFDWVVVPLSIKAGRTTALHLDKGWKPTFSARNNDLVNLPGGYVIGWSASPVVPGSNQ
jgi:hypothetical protein